MTAIDALLGRCPRCRKGRIFKPGLLGLAGAMYNECAVCRLPSLRETGYYLGAMYVSYALGIFTILPIGVVLAVILEWPLWIAMAIVVIQTVVSMPIFLRISRTVWLYVDQAVDPR